jgi:hypothetical protein
MSGRFVIDPGSSRIAIHTRAQGVFAAFAHDLELTTTDVRGTAVDDGNSWSAEVAVPVESIHVAGALRGERVDQNVLSAADRADIEQRLRREVLVAPEVLATGRGTARERGEVTVAVGGVRATVPTTLQVSAGGGGHLRAKGRAELSLSALRIREVKGPLGAFKVADKVEVLYELELVPEAAPGAA